MRKLFIAGNWKMNLNRAQAAALAEGIFKKTKEGVSCDIAVFPSYVYLDKVESLLKGSHVLWGGQNCASQKQGAFTGEISAEMLKEFGCQYVLLGHSERRHIYGESNSLIAEKFAQVLEAGLKPILCVGETLEQREAGQTLAVIYEQLDAILNLSATPFQPLENWLVAYEPVWAIGTGKTATGEQAEEVHAQIREYIEKKHGNFAEHLRIIYGGSVKAVNAADLMRMPNIDGLLIGGASLNLDEFVEICICSKSL